jgi:thiol-disulfide isomerase/thioredoxin
MSSTTAAPGALIAAGEATFARRVRAAKVPVVVAFRAPHCEASRALVLSLAQLAQQYASRLVVLSVDVERAPLLAEQYGVAAVPTLLVLQDHDELTRMVGFASPLLLRLLFDQVVAGELVPGMLWSPTEQAFEDAVIIPLLDAWGWSYQRQVSCKVQKGKTTSHGRVDILVYADGATKPLTLFEAKRQIAYKAALQQAMAQAQGYAQALDLATFVVAAPVGLWIYRLHSGKARLVEMFSSLDVATDSDIVRRTLQSIDEAR